MIQCLMTAKKERCGLIGSLMEGRSILGERLLYTLFWFQHLTEV